MLHAVSNLHDVTRYVSNNTMDPTRYIQETNPHPVNSNISSNKHHSRIEDVLDLTNLPVKDIHTTSHVAPLSGNEKIEYIHSPLQLLRTVPEYEATTNLGNQQVYKRQEYENTIELERNMPNGSFASNPTRQGVRNHGSRTGLFTSKVATWWI